MANFHNNGPASSILANATFFLVVPPDCTVLANNPFTVLNRNLPASVSVGMMRSWSVRCTGTGGHNLSANVSVEIAPGQGWTESDPTNNGGSGSGATTILAPTPSPSPAPAP
jgi:hypothetical protein